MIRTILVDDEDIIREGISRFIKWEELGLELTGLAANGVEALALLEQTDPEIIITDVKMPKMDGLELLARAKKQNPGCIVIMISSYDEFEYAQQALNLGAFAYLLKPIDTDRFIELLEVAAKRLIWQNNREALLQKAEKLMVDAPSDVREPERLSHIICKAKEYMETHYQNPQLRLEEVAGYVYMNSSYFSTIFSKEMKISFGNYLTQIRMNKAMELLKTTDRKIYEIGEQCGYQNVSWFTVAFKKYTGKSPGEYRRT